MRSDDSVAPAHIAQLRQAQNTGDWMILSPDVGTVAGDLQRLDKGLKVRFSQSGKCWAIFHEKHGDCPHNGTADTYLVRTVRAYMTDLGVWGGLDGRVVERMEELKSFRGGGYRLGDELEQARKRREAKARSEFREKVGEAGELMAHALRKDLGLGPYKGRVFKPRDV